MKPSSLTLGYAPGTTPAKWARIWAERHPEVPLHLRAVSAADAAGEVRAGRVDVALLRLPADTSGLAVIPLYEETTVAVLPTDHLLSATDELTPADLEESRYCCHSTTSSAGLRRPVSRSSTVLKTPWPQSNSSRRGWVS